MLESLESLHDLEAKGGETEAFTAMAVEIRTSLIHLQGETLAFLMRVPNPAPYLASTLEMVGKAIEACNSILLTPNLRMMDTKTLATALYATANLTLIEATLDGASRFTTPTESTRVNHPTNQAEPSGARQNLII